MKCPQLCKLPAQAALLSLQGDNDPSELKLLGFGSSRLLAIAAIERSRAPYLRQASLPWFHQDATRRVLR